jgi:hypothetical protein
MATGGGLLDALRHAAGHRCSRTSMTTGRFPFLASHDDLPLFRKRFSRRRNQSPLADVLVQNLHADAAVVFLCPDGVEKCLDVPLPITRRQRQASWRQLPSDWPARRAVRR